MPRTELTDADQITILDTYLDSKINARQGYRLGTHRWEDGEVTGVVHLYSIDESPVIVFEKYRGRIKRVHVGEKVGTDLSRAGVIFYRIQVGSTLTEEGRARLADITHGDRA